MSNQTHRQSGAGFQACVALASDCLLRHWPISSPHWSLSRCSALAQNSGESSACRCVSRFPTENHSEGSGNPEMVSLWQVRKPEPFVPPAAGWGLGGPRASCPVPGPCRDLSPAAELSAALARSLCRAGREGKPQPHAWTRSIGSPLSLPLGPTSLSLIVTAFQFTKHRLWGLGCSVWALDDPVPGTSGSYSVSQNPGTPSICGTNSVPTPKKHFRFLCRRVTELCLCKHGCEAFYIFLAAGSHCVALVSQYSLCRLC